MQIRALPTVNSVPVWGEQDRQDTIYDAIMDHYTSRRSPGAFREGFLQVLSCEAAHMDASLLGGGCIAYYYIIIILLSYYYIIIIIIVTLCCFSCNLQVAIQITPSLHLPHSYIQAVTLGHGGAQFLPHTLIFATVSALTDPCWCF